MKTYLDKDNSEFIKGTDCTMEKLLCNCGDEMQIEKTGWYIFSRAFFVRCSCGLRNVIQYKKL